MTGLFERALGADWKALHPKLRERYGVVAADGREVVGRGRMDRLWSNDLLLPVLWLGTFEDFLFPEGGADVPFRIATRPFVDAAGEEALLVERRFRTDPPRRFVDALRWNDNRGRVTDLFGRTGRLAADLHLRVEDGDLLLAVGDQWLRTGGRYVRLPRPLAVEAVVRDRYDADEEAFRVTADVHNPLLGRVFSYRGRFRIEGRPVTVSADGSTLGEVALPGGNG